MCVCVCLSACYFVWGYPLSGFTEINYWCGLHCVYATSSIHTQSTCKKVAHMCMKPENVWNERWCETLFALYNKHFFELINTLEIALSWQGHGITLWMYCEFKSLCNFKHFQLYKNRYVRLCCAFHNLRGEEKHPFEAEQSVAFDVSGCVMKSLQNNQQHANWPRPQPKVMRSVCPTVCSPAWLPVSPPVCQGCAEIEISTWMMCVRRQSENFQLGFERRVWSRDGRLTAEC